MGFIFFGFEKIDPKNGDALNAGATNGRFGQ